LRQSSRRRGGEARFVLSSLSISVDAPPELVFRLARPVERWAALLPHYARSRVVRTLDGGGLVVAFMARRPVPGLPGLELPVAWRARTWSHPESRQLRFIHVAGATKGMDVTWRIEPAGGGTRITIEHDFRPRLPGFARFVDRFFTGPIARRTLAAFKGIAESIQEIESADPPPAKKPV
jgi:ribosome-associated toxin RatA of RatAB toxin-antitoxin module